MTDQDTHRQLHLASAYISMNRPQQALDLLAEPNSAMLEDAAYWALRAQALHNLERNSEALEATARGLELNPDFADLHLLRSRCQMQEQDLAAAELSILAALRQNAENPRYLSHYAWLLALGKQFDKADRILGEAQRLTPDDRGVKRISGVVAYLKGDSDAAVEIMQDVLAEDADDPYAQSFLGSVEMEEGNVRRGIQGMRSGGQLNPGDASLASGARQANLMANPFMWPLWPVVRFGPGVIWIGAMATVFGLRALGLGSLSGMLAIAYLVWVIYTWTVPRLIKWWYQRQYGR